MRCYIRSSLGLTSGARPRMVSPTSSPACAHGHLPTGIMAPSVKRIRQFRVAYICRSPARMDAPKLALRRCRSHVAPALHRELLPVLNHPQQYVRGPGSHVCTLRLAHGASSGTAPAPLRQMALHLACQRCTSSTSTMTSHMRGYYYDIPCARILL